MHTGNVKPSHNVHYKLFTKLLETILGVIPLGQLEERQLQVVIY